MTIATINHAALFGQIAGDSVILNQAGEITKKAWLEIPGHFANVILGAYVIMPNHLHGIITIEYDVGARHASPLPNSQVTQGPKPRTLGAIVGSFKSATTKRSHQAGILLGKSLWQQNYYEHIIRDEHELERVCDYIDTNPENWSSDSQVLFPPS